MSIGDGQGVWLILTDLERKRLGLIHARNCKVVIVCISAYYDYSIDAHRFKSVTYISRCVQKNGAVTAILDIDLLDGFAGEKIGRKPLKVGSSADVESVH